MKLRIKKYILDATAADLRNERARTGDSLAVCKLKLQEKLPQSTLQYLDPDAQMWLNVPVFEVYRTPQDINNNQI